MDTDFRFACVECGFDCAGDGWDEYWNLNVKKEFVKILQKIFICHICNAFKFFIFANSPPPESKIQMGSSLLIMIKILHINITKKIKNKERKRRLCTNITMKQKL